MLNYFLENMDLTDICPQVCGWEDCESGHFYGPAVRQYWLIHYIVSGQGEYHREGRHYHLRQGQAFLIRPWEVTEYAADGENPWQYVWIGFTGRSAEKLLEQTPFSGNRCILTDPRLGGLFSGLKSSPQDTISVTASLWELFRLLRQPEKQERTDYVTAAAEYFSRNYAMKITVEDAARAVGIDRRYLHRLFTERMGLSPKEYLTSLRLQQSKKLLEQGLNVKEAAMSVGYEDAFNFSRMFHKKFGFSPVSVRRQGKEKRQKAETETE